MSQGDIERKCGLKRCCISQVENSHTVPCVDTLDKWARALSVPLYQVFYDGDQPPTLPPTERSGLWGSSSKEARLPELFRKAFALMNEDEEQLLMHMGRKMERANQSASHVNRRPQVA